MDHTDIIKDTDAFFEIDPITRVITNKCPDKTKVMQYDHNSERFTFCMPQFVEGHDMLGCKVEVRYINIDTNTKEETKGLYEVKDVQKHPEKNDHIMFSWLLSQNVTRRAGVVHFLIRFSCVAEDTTIDYAWSTEQYRAISVAEGIYNADVIEELYADVFEQWKAEILAEVGDVKKEVDEAKETALTEMNTAKTKAVKDIQEEGQRIADSLPDDYAGVQAELTELESKLSAEIDEVEAIAKGRASGHVFDTVADMQGWLANSDNVATLKLGDNLYIRATDVPDYWWDGTTAQVLETQKVELGEYAKKKDIPTAISDLTDDTDESPLYNAIYAENARCDTSGKDIVAQFKNLHVTKVDNAIETTVRATGGILISNVSPTNYKATIKDVSSTGKVIEYGLNMWDEEITEENNYVASKNYIEVAGNKKYYFHTVLPGGYGVKYIYFYDKNFVKIDTLDNDGYSRIRGSISFTTPSNCYYIKFVVGTGWQDGLSVLPSSYCINVYDENINGTYEKYVQKKERAIGDEFNLLQRFTTLITHDEGVFDITYTKTIDNAIETLEKDVDELKGINIESGEGVNSIQQKNTNKTWMPSEDVIRALLGIGDTEEIPEEALEGLKAFPVGVAEEASEGATSLGVETTSTGKGALSSGINTIAFGDGAFSAGKDTLAMVLAAAFGLGTIALHPGQFVRGMYNEIDREGKYLDIVGNGVNEGEVDENGDPIIYRRNAYALDGQGNGYYLGDLYVGKDRKKVATEESWELIQSGELSEEVASLDLKGFSCSKIILKMKVQGSANNTTDNAPLAVFVNGTSNDYRIKNANLTSIFRNTNEGNTNPHIFLEVRNKSIIGQLFGTAGTSYGYINREENDNINKLFLKPDKTGIVFGVGTTYELWGVRN